MSPRLKIWLTSTLAAVFGAAAVLIASCAELNLAPEADAQTPDAAPKDSAASLDTKVPGSGAPDGDPFIGQIMLFAGNFAPRGWALCDGARLAINQYSALYAVIGTTYGGDGTTYFNLPDLRGRFPIGAGQGSGLTKRPRGQTGGTETVTLNTTQMPSHSHALISQSLSGSTDSPLNNFVASHSGAFSPATSRTGTMEAMHAGAIGNAGEGQPVANMPPFVGVSYIIAVEGTFPNRN